MPGKSQNRRLLPSAEGKVFFGAWVEIENDDGVTHVSVLSATMKFLAVKITSLSIPDGPRIAEKRSRRSGGGEYPAGEASWYVNAIEYVKP